GRRRVGEHVQPLRSRRPVRRLQGVRLRPGGRAAGPPSLRGAGVVDVRKTYKLYVGGEFVRSESGRSYEVQGLNVPRASGKDVRDAVRLARGAVAGWSRRTAMNRGQVLYRVAEMLDARRSQFIALLGGGRPAGREVDAAVEAFVWYAGLADKLAQLLGTVNPVAARDCSFTIPESTGVVGLA